MDSRYEEALERCRKEFDFNNLAYSHEEIKQRLERVFPELRESEDDRIRNAVLKAIMTDEGRGAMKNSGFKVEDVLSWLEKRGNQTIITDVLIKAGLKPYKDGDKWCVLAGDNIQNGVCGFGDTIDEALFEFLKELCEKQSEQKPVISDDALREGIAHFGITQYQIDNWLKKYVDVEKPTDNVKPKFKVGDWVVWYNKISFHVDNIYQVKNSLMYTVTDTNNTTYSVSVKGFDNNAHLWTIQDAKYGDVLFTSSTASHEIFLFKELDRNNNIKCLCSYDSESGFCEGKYHFIGKPSFNTRPATKEQRDLLFQKMREAGYGREPEPADNVEPKFNVGDWVRAISSGNIFKIISINDGLYYVLCHDGVEANYPVEVGKDLVYWTIQDAKDGDVLATESGRPFIFKGCLDEKHPNSPVSYCGIDSTDCFYNYKGSAWWTDENVHPATKEQRDLLFTKMHEAGYEWDAENKKLLTIEQNPIRPVCYNNMDDLIADAMINEINQSNLPESSKHNRIFWIKSHRQKRDWSEKDEEIFQKVKTAIDSYYAPFSRDAEEMSEWFKNLKDRVQPQPKREWSEEDEQNLKGIIDEIEANKAACPEYDEKAYDMFISWLKSIKERMKRE